MGAISTLEVSSWVLADDDWDTSSPVPSRFSNDLDWDEEEEEYHDNDDDDDWWSDYSFCATLTRSSYIAEDQANDLFAADFNNESRMNAAGRTTMHPYRDFRSASYARKHSWKKSKPGPRTRGIASRKWEHAHCRRDNKRRKRDILRYEIYTNQRQDKVHCSSPGRPKNTESVTWDVNLEEEFDQDIIAMWDGVLSYEKFHKHAEVFESSELYTETGETFSLWAQRRIAEMRAVKESRTRTQAAPRQRPMVYKTDHIWGMRIGVSILDYHTYCGSPLTTTLPTNAYDAYGHARLRAALTPSKQVRRMARFDPKISPFPMVYDYSWFGEYTWRWHRNSFGCWQIGYGYCGERAIPCACSDSRCSCYYYRCYCEEFEGKVAPEEQQRCSLVEWVGSEGRRLIRADEAWAQAESGTRDSEVDVAADSDGDWSFVDEYCGVQSCSSAASSVDFNLNTRA